MKPLRVSMGSALIAMGIAYVMVGPWPCERSPFARCGTVAFDYGSDSSLLPYQALVTMLLFGAIAGLGTWFWLERERSPLPVRVGVRTILLGLAVLGIGGIGGMFGIGAPFVVPLLWMAARHSGTWGRVGWTVVASVCAAAGSWLVAIPLGIAVTEEFALAVALVTAAVFLLSTRSNPDLPQRLTNDLG
jgi:hypothetical protein